MAVPNLSCDMCDLVSWLGIEPRPPELGAWSLATRPPGKSWIILISMQRSYSVFNQNNCPITSPSPPTTAKFLCPIKAVWQNCLHSLFLLILSSLLILLWIYLHQAFAPLLHWSSSSKHCYRSTHKLPNLQVNFQSLFLIYSLSSFWNNLPSSLKQCLPADHFSQFLYPTPPLKRPMGVSHVICTIFNFWFLPTNLIFLCPSSCSGIKVNFESFFISHQIHWANPIGTIFQTNSEFDHFFSPQLMLPWL